MHNDRHTELCFERRKKRKKKAESNIHIRRGKNRSINRIILLLPLLFLPFPFSLFAFFYVRSSGGSKFFEKFIGHGSWKGGQNEI